MITRPRIAPPLVLAFIVAVLSAAPASAASVKVRLDMKDCDGDVTAPVDETTWNADAVASVAGGIQAICAAVFGDADAAAPGSVTFAIVSGPGRFTDATGAQDFGTTTTVAPGATYNQVYLSSTASGTTIVRASADLLKTDGTKTWTAGAARTVVVPAPSGSSSSALRAVTATVRDLLGNGVPGVTVTFGSSGVGTMSSAPQQVTGSDGQATVVVERSAGETGTQTVTATISQAQTDCERAAGDPEGASAGICSAAINVVWTASRTELSLAAEPKIGVIGTTFALLGTLSAGQDEIGGRTVVVQRQTGGGFAFVGEGVTDELGRFVVHHNPSANTVYRAVFSGDDMLLSAVSLLTGVGVRPGVILNATPQQTRAGGVVAFTGRVIPAHPGRPIYLQQYSPTSGWRTITSMRLSSSSTYAFRVVKRSAGYLLFRTAIASDADHVWNISINRRVDWT